MIEPKFREIMQQFETGVWRVRLWFNRGDEPELVTRMSQCANVSDRAYDAIAISDYGTPDDVERVLLATLEPSDGLSAYEIVYRDGGHGIIGYIDWP